MVDVPRAARGGRALQREVAMRLAIWSGGWKRC